MDITRGKFPLVRSIPMMLAYVLFFPHLIAGPILRPVELIPQLEHPRPASFRRLIVPVAIFTSGLLKKLVIADQVAEVVNAIYAQPGVPDAPHAILAVVAFAVQIYCDFSGYTDMAIGLALMLGIRLPNNFARPYAATSISDLWRRWHITLTRFLMDFVYTPLSLRLTRFAAMRRYRKWGSFALAVAIPVNVTFLVSGIWHGAGWNFVLFGVITGIAMSINFAWRLAKMPVLPPTLAWLLTMLAFLLSLAVFRARSLSGALDMAMAPWVGSWQGTLPLIEGNLLPILLIAVFAVTHRFDDHRRIKAIVRKVRPELVWTGIAFCWILAITMSQGSSAQFVYFDF
ncbi:hypothetical protein A6A04_03720 [Paramagnetospirillum marisnigri]|uniref:Probable alginate O-acetylase AlgI n=1 Tax=Paramagnetospirillum marisnigri TaxID=1285242 RepID=A0A178ML07_9PROT|nr:hypothetical protein A6A04_03720 [Paramagnetospirillum marisnigri]